MKINVLTTLRGVWAGDRDVFAVGDNGVILVYSSPPAGDPCPINVTISVTAENMPIISWQPDCPVSKLFVEDWGVNGYDLSWFIAADGNLIEPGVRYGAVPDNAVEWCRTGALRKEELYRVSLIRRDWDNEILVGSWNFIPTDSLADGSPAITKAKAQGPDDWLARAYAGPSGNNYSFRNFFLPRLRQTIPGQPVFGCADVRLVGDDYWRWLLDPAEREDVLNIRPVIIEKLIIDPDTGLQAVLTSDYYRAADLTYGGSLTVVWDILRP